MRIMIVSGSRSDRNGLVMVKKALEEAGHFCWFLPLDSPLPEHPAVTMNDAVSKCFVYGKDMPERWDLGIVHGDRYEIVAAALAMNVAGIPIAHIGGGDITEGSQDDCFRHAITKLSHLHFVSHDHAYQRVLQMGEEEHCVFMTGCPGIDMVLSTKVSSRDETLERVGLPLDAQRVIVVLFHPNTLGDTRSELDALAGALRVCGGAIVLLGPNHDLGANLIRDEWQKLCIPKSDILPVRYHDNLQPQLFYSLLHHADVLIGNSSAGYYEAPCFGIPVVDLGDRQMGRPRASNIMNCSFARGSDGITQMLRRAIAGRHSVKAIANPYGDGKAAQRIADVISQIDDPKELLRKRFVEIEMPTDEGGEDERV